MLLFPFYAVAIWLIAGRWRRRWQGLAAVILGTLVFGVSAWNNGLVTRLQQLVTQLTAVR